eukprot:965599-Prymnesium_polylepis.1
MAEKAGGSWGTGGTTSCPCQVLCIGTPLSLLDCSDTPRTAAPNRGLDSNSPGVPMRTGLPRTSHTPHAHLHRTPPPYSATGWVPPKPLFPLPTATPRACKSDQ